MQNLPGALLLPRSSAGRVPALDAQTRRQEGCGRKAEPGATGSATTPTASARPGEVTVPASPWAALPTAVGEGPGGAARRNPLPGVPRPRARVPEVKPGDKGGPASPGPTPRHTAGLGLTPPATAPCRTIHLPISSLPRHFPTSASVSPPPPVSPLTRCHSPPHRPAAVPPSSSSPAAAAAAVCSVPVVARDWRQEIGAISPSTAGPLSPSGG